MAAASGASGAGKEEALDDQRPEVWAPYVVRSVPFGKKHPGKLVEATLLAATMLPQAAYSVVESLQAQIDDGRLSNVQLEGIVYASQRFQTFIPSANVQCRAGFLIADAAGVGKGRQIAGLILDNLVRNRNKHCWFSVSQDLHLDATRDLRDIGCMVNICKSIADLKHCPKNAPSVLFSTYAGLISKGDKSSLRSRMQELVDWLTVDCPAETYEGVIVFDEAHKAKNFRLDGKGSTQVGNAVHQLQLVFPNARILYSSATMVSDVSDMAYMTRLGYWGDNCMYPTFEVFKQVMDSLEVSGMELLAVDMKSTGRAVVRNVSYEGAEFTVRTAQLKPQDARLYRDACLFWADVLENTRKANGLCSNDLGFEGKSAGALFWAAHQRFFAQLILSLKVEACIEEVEQALAKGMAAIIGLQTTGGAALARSMLQQDKGYGGVISVCKSVAMLYLTGQFPVKRQFTVEHQHPFYQPNMSDLWVELALIGKHCGGGGFSKLIQCKILSYAYDEDCGALPWPMYREDNQVVECVRMRDQLIERLEALNLPAGALDTLIDRLGGKDQVAEMTGRSHRLVRSLANPQRFELEKRLDCSFEDGEGGDEEEQWWTDSDTTKSISVNVLEKNAFLKDLKRVAIISSAASTGISLHADRAVKNQRRRFHITLELPWAGDQAVQQLGRSHRTNQSSAPVFCLLSSGLGGESRFVSSVARRLQSLGALTQGDRRASLGAMSFGELQYESKYGVEALRNLFKHTGKRVPELVPGVDWEQVVLGCKEQIDLDFAGGMDPNVSACPLVPCRTQPEFLQAVLAGLTALDLSHERAASLSGRIALDAAVLEAKRKGQFDQGFRHLEGKPEIIKASQVLYTDSFGHSAVINDFKSDTSISYDEAIQQLHYRVGLAKGYLMDEPHGLACAMLMDETESLLRDAKTLGVGQFYRRCIRVGDDPTYFVLLSFNSPDPRSAFRQVLRPTGRRIIDLHSLQSLYEPFPSQSTTLVQDIFRQWDQSYSCPRVKRESVRTLQLVCGNLLPILGDLEAIHNRDRERPGVLEGYAITTHNQGKRVFGVRMHDLASVRKRLSARMARDNLFQLVLNKPVKFGKLGSKYDFGFGLDSENKVVSVSNLNLGIQVGMHLVSVNGTTLKKNVPIGLQVREIGEVMVLNDHAGRLPKSKPNLDDHLLPSLSFEFSRKSTLGDHLTGAEAAGKVSFTAMDQVNVDPEKERIRKEKRKRKLKDLFGSDLDDDDDDDGGGGGGSARKKKTYSAEKKRKV
ncbi:hypothetical protein BASA81_001983 [Batrachochytrium salamandrivorans]|nr:hypothetical protein BASA81_001983 [Batrachochytrium salamandrivorans]